MNESQKERYINKLPHSILLDEIGIEEQKKEYQEVSKIRNGNKILFGSRKKEDGKFSLGCSPKKENEYKKRRP